MKFSLTKNTKDWFGTTLFQIKAEMSFWNISKWELGWRIEKEENLSQDGDAWVSGDARVYGNAWVSGNARVYGNACVSGNASVSGKIKLQFWWCFARKEKDWDISEVENEWIILMIKDYKPAEEEKKIVELTVEEICEKLWAVERLKEKYEKNYKEMRLEIPTGEIIWDLKYLLSQQQDDTNR